MSIKKLHVAYITMRQTLIWKTKSLKTTVLKFRYASAKIAANPIMAKANIKYLKITASPLSFKSLIMKQAIPQGKQNRITMFARCIRSLINLRILTIASRVDSSSPSGLALIFFVQSPSTRVPPLLTSLAWQFFSMPTTCIIKLVRDVLKSWLDSSSIHMYGVGVKKEERCKKKHSWRIIKNLYYL